ncbi:mycothiol transferase [Citricoccus sp. I39-566]|uniref:mycothiol transferase n=1 Tax=Citricoccus sp. I39-566 TaxID=3073268 RepID=UPI00286BA565|nr:DinB family protein [Citricoccus sp. I39-566]WMY77645.1 DinB family protein [Citricoccus sp. I39-566]
MDSVELLKDLARRPLEELEQVWDRIGPDRLNVHPGGHPNSIAWLLWHTGREIDAQVAQAAGRQEVWTAQGWEDRFALELPDPGHGFGHSEQQARHIVVRDRELLRGYLAAVTEESIGYLDSLSAADLDEVIDHDWDPPVTRGVRLVSVYADALQHVGQAAYVLGMD